ncbi:MAG: glycosyltransferase family 4 protein [Magnetospirillum sp.]|nr:glycosyltransferase family 4 protein [Magnetospirillum sp.]
MAAPHRVLIMTLPPFTGGVPAKCAILARHLRQLGHEVSIAYYATLSDHPELAAPSWRILSGARPGSREARVFGDFVGRAVGCWLPELEFSYYLPSTRWDALIDAHQRHVAVGGTALVSYPLNRRNLPHLVWCACGMVSDRADRHAAMAWPRRLLDSLLTIPVQRVMERRILKGPGRILTVATSGRDELRALGGSPERVTTMPIPVDAGHFRPPAVSAPAGVIGFAGRLGDPRKNIGLLIEAARLVQARTPIRLRLCGEPDPAWKAKTEAQGDPVEWLGHVAYADLPAFYGSLDVFALPSHQEGFGIVGSEALACGVPVVSTDCGGPRDYVIAGQTGFLVNKNPEEMAERLLAIITDRDLRHGLSASGRALAERRFSTQAFASALDAAWTQVWNESP